MKVMGPGCAPHARAAARPGNRYLSGLGERRLLHRVRPVEPIGQDAEVRRLDGRAGPDAEMRRRVAMEVDVVGDAFLVQARGDVLEERLLRLFVEASDLRIDDLQ